MRKKWGRNQSIGIGLGPWRSAICFLWIQLSSFNLILNRRTDQWKIRENWRAAPTGASTHVLLVGSAYWAFCAPILSKESGFYRGKREPWKRSGAREIPCADPTLLKGSYFLTWTRRKRKYIEYNMAAKLWSKIVPSATVPGQYLSIDTTSYPPSFSSDTTFNVLIEQE